jgi:hypothetical protein
MDQIRAWSPLAQCHLERVDGDMTTEPATHRPTDDASRVQIHDHGQVQPALVSPQIGDVGRPSLVDRFSREVLVQQIAGRCTTALGVDPEAPLRTFLRRNASRLNSALYLLLRVM